MQSPPNAAAVGMYLQDNSRVEEPHYIYDMLFVLIEQHTVLYFGRQYFCFTC